MAFVRRRERVSPNQSQANLEVLDQPDWKARYEMWMLASNEIKHAFAVTLPGFAMEPFVRMTGGAWRRPDGYMAGQSVSLPLDISDDLRRAVILDTAVVFPTATPNEETAPPGSRSSSAPPRLTRAFAAR